VNTGLKGCGARADIKDVLTLFGNDPRLRGDSDPLQNLCGSDLATFIIGERGTRLCQLCCIKFGLIW
jgi:hypothetical protein